MNVKKRSRHVGGALFLYGIGKGSQLAVASVHTIRENNHHTIFPGATANDVMKLPESFGTYMLRHGYSFRF